MKRFARNTLLLTLCLSLGACTSMQTVADSRNALHAGDKITLHTRDGKQLDWTVAAVDASAISGSEAGQRVPHEQVERVERAEFDAVKTIGLAALGLATVGYFALRSVGKDIVSAVVPK
jgi:hypothetical protein